MTIDGALRAAAALDRSPGSAAGGPDAAAAASSAARAPAAAPARAALVTVARATGSTPRGPGSRMLVREDGSIIGSVGGGLPEARAIEAALAAIAAAGPDAAAGPRVLAVEMAGAEARGSDLICGGSAEFWIEPITPNAAAAYAAAVAMVDRGERVVIAASSATGIASVEAAPDGPIEAAIDGQGLFRCPVEPAERLLVLGGGHVGLELSRIAARLGFSVTVADPRPEFSDPARFGPEVSCLRAGFAAAIEGFAPGGRDYAVVVSPGHLGDLDCARALMRFDCRYVGAIGSRRKAAMIIGALIDEGVDRGKAESIRLPIGLDIGAETPEEIAISIAAELVAARRSPARLELADRDRRARRRAAPGSDAAEGSGQAIP